MNNFYLVGELYLLPVLHKLYRLQPERWKNVTARGEINSPEIGLGASLLLRSHGDITQDNWLKDLPISDTPVLDEWPAMQDLLGTSSTMIMNNPISQKLLTGKMGRAMMSRLDAGSTIFWHVDDGPYHERHARFHLPLITSLGCRLYSGSEDIHLPAGTLWYFNNKIRHSAANWGPFPRVHLIFEMEKT